MAASTLERGNRGRRRGWSASPLTCCTTWACSAVRRLSADRAAPPCWGTRSSALTTDVVPAAPQFGNWTTPAIGLTVFIVMFTLSTWVIGPAISGSSDVDSPVPTIDHSSHH